MNAIKKYILLFTLLTLSIVIVACGGDSKDSSEPNETGTSGEPEYGGTVVGTLEEAPGGVFNPIFYTDLYEEKMLEFTHEGLVRQDEELNFSAQLAKDWEINEDQTEITFTLEDDVTWHDGEKFTADDVVFTYQTLMDPEYVAAGGLRTLFVEPLLDYEAYSSGETDTFEAVVAEDEKTVTFKFENSNPNLLYYTSFPLIPKHIYEDIPISDMLESPYSLDPEKVIGTGPFEFASMVDRESYEMVRYDDYWQGKPYLDKVVWKVVDPSVMVGLLDKGELDFIASPSDIPEGDFEQVSSNDDIEIIKQTDFSLKVLGFKLNHRTTDDVQNNVINPDNWQVNEKIANQNVRQAIAYAIDREGIVNGLLFGIGEIVESPIPQQFWAHNDDVVNHYDFDPEKAKSILDEEGYVDVTGDGMREDPNGDEWVLNLDTSSRDDRLGPIIQEQLEDVGIKVNLRQPKEFSAFLVDIENDNSDWDLYLIGWGLNHRDPDPSEVWSIMTPYNYARWNNKEADELLKQAMEGPDSFEQEYREKVYAEWQKEFSEDLPELILYAEEALWAHNKRLQGVESLPYSMYHNVHKWWVND